MRGCAAGEIANKGKPKRGDMAKTKTAKSKEVTNNARAKKVSTKRPTAAKKRPRSPSESPLEQGRSEPSAAA